jgi:type I restriction enzyme S subunit
MRHNWPKVSLGKVLTKSEEWITLEPDKRYKEVTVRLWGKGVFLRKEVNGVEIAAQRRLVARENQFIISRIDARNGAFGLIPESLNGAIVSNDFPVFNLDEGQVEPLFLNWMSKTNTFVDLCTAASEGTTNRVRLQEDRFLAASIFLPPLPEQQRIVARIESLAAKIDRIHRLRKSTEEDSENLCRSLIFSDSKSAVLTPLFDLVSLREPNVLVKSDETYHFAGVYCFGKGVFRGQRKSGMEFAYPLLTRIRKGNFVYPKLMAWEGALGIVPSDCDGLFVSPEFPVFKLNEDRVLPEVLDVYFRTPSVWPFLAGASTGTNVRRRRLNPKDFLSYQMPLPPMSTQEKLANVKTNVDDLKKLHAETAAEFNALLPSILDKAFKGEL